MGVFEFPSHQSNPNPKYERRQQMDPTVVLGYQHYFLQYLHAHIVCMLVCPCPSGAQGYEQCKSLSFILTM